MNNLLAEKKDEVECRECGESFQGITNTHLATHDMTIEEYCKKYPDAKRLSESYREQLAEASSGTNNPQFGKKEEDHPAFGLTRPEQSQRMRGDTNPMKREMVREKFKGSDHPNWRPKISKQCDLCEDSFEVPPCLEARMFCSQKCAAKAHSERMSGENNPMAGRPSPMKGEELPEETRQKIAETKKGEKNPNWKGGHEHYYGSNWCQQRRIVRIRDNHACRRCGAKTEDLGREPDVHHIIPFREFGVERYVEANSELNLICLCRPCHLNIELEKQLPEGVPLPISSKQPITVHRQKQIVAL